MIYQRLLPFPDDHPHNLRRVSGRIAALVVEFVTARVGQVWHAGDLHKFVAEREQISPASADRVLRDLRQRGKVAYELVSRRSSEYRSLPLEAR